jgi:O-6-methylguanine DNA methyltransferase
MFHTCFVVNSPIGTLRLEACVDGLVALSWTDLPLPTSLIRGSALNRARRSLLQGAAWLRTYFAGRVGSPPALRDGQPTLPAPRASRAPSPAAHHRGRVWRGRAKRAWGGGRWGAEGQSEPSQGSHLKIPLPPLPPLAARGTAFQKAVWRHVARIRPGTTITYGEIARRLRMPGASRAVGQAVGANPLPILIPCHRVLAAGGKLGGYSSGLRRKRWLLAHEGILLPARGRGRL